MITTALFEELFGVNAGYVEKVYGDYAQDPTTVGDEWISFFEEHLPEEMRVARRPEAAESAATDSPADSATAGAAGQAASAADDPELEPLRGIAGRIVTNMAQSLAVPTATSTRDVPVKVLEENRKVINLHRQANFMSKVSFTHLIAWAMVKALREVPAMTQSFAEIGGKAFRRTPQKVQLGIAVDLPGKDGRRSLMVPNIHDVLSVDFAGFLEAFDQQIKNARDGKLKAEDFKNTTCSLTNPGTLGTVSSLPRLMDGQAFILATGAIGVPAAYQGAAPATLNKLAISKVMTISSTYDHRVIQGAESGRFLAAMHQYLVGDHGFYEEIFRALRLPYSPVKFAVDQHELNSDDVIAGQQRAARVMQYIRMYRVRGYVLADLNPLEFTAREHPELDMSSYGLTLWDKDREFFSGGVIPQPRAKLRDIQAVLQKTYTRDVGVEFMHIADSEQKEWLQERMESNCNEEELSKDAMLRVLDSLIEAEAFERFLHTRFVGHKRFSLEGGETLIPALEALLDRGAERGVERAVLGMAHRGRLNVLAHVMGKSLEKIFREFEGWIDPDSPEGSGDVKYHLGAEGEYKTAAGGTVALELACNPSHLEAVNPVVEGTVRARQDELGDGARDSGRRHHAVLPILVHGDAAFAGQGVVFETLNMSQLPGFGTGGTVHLIVNNQIGYTTLPEDSRSTPFCTDVAKGIQAPVFHVNGDNPLAAVRMVRLAMDYRERFGRDVVLDIVCYRRHGHNEGDEPSYTQPLLYKTIESHRTVRERYQDYLLRAGVIGPEDVERFDQSVGDRLRQSLDAIRGDDAPPSGTVDPWAKPPAEVWKGIDTKVPLERLQTLTDDLLRIPDGYSPHPKLQMVLKRRADMIAGKQPVDFATAEQLAFATLVTDDRIGIRLSGQDSGRGTFSQRHAVLRDVKTGGKYVPLADLGTDDKPQATFEVVDSFLSEEAALGFEYGYSSARPNHLVLWEAQFGDFCNGAQIQIDQFLAAGESKWNQRCSLVLLLPHGYDGQGPEHSSARLERFLQLCAENNMRVANPSTAAQYYHMLRQQALSKVRKPLVVMTPKSLLRMKAAGSAPEDLSDGGFQPVIDDPCSGKATRIVLCSGKVYHDLDETRGDDDTVALVRVEQLYPWPSKELKALRKRTGKAKWYWCQEEPANMGPWDHVRWREDWAGYCGRPAAASPATGSLQAHKIQQAALVARALGRDV